MISARLRLALLSIPVAAGCALVASFDDPTTSASGSTSSGSSSVASSATSSSSGGGGRPPCATPDGGSCGGHACDPTTLISGAIVAASIDAAYANAILACNEVDRAPLDGGAHQAAHACDTTNVGEIAGRPDALFFANESTIWVFREMEGKSAGYWFGAKKIFLDTAHDQLVWVEPSMGKLVAMNATKPVWPQDLVADTLGDVRSIASDGTHLLWLTAAGEIVSADDAGGAKATALKLSGGPFTAIGARPGELFATTRSTLVHLDTSAHAPADFQALPSVTIGQLGAPIALAVTKEDVAWIERSSAKTATDALVRLDCSGAPAVVRSDIPPGSVPFVAVDDAAFYWIDANGLERLSR